MRQTSDRIVATIDVDDIFTLNSALILRLINENDYEFVLGVLNSNIGAYIYKSVSQEEGRAFAEVKPQNVRKLFIPSDKDIKKPISDLVNEIMNILRNDPTQSIDEHLKQINDLLYEYYNLSKQEIEIIEKEVNY